MLTAYKNKLLILLTTILISNFYFVPPSYSVIDLTVGGQFAIDKDDQLKRFQHDALDNLQMIDFFLCVMKVRADLFPNSNYKAQVNEAACERLSGESDENAPKVAMADITLSCTRASNTAPQICKTWYNLSGENRTYLVKVQMDAEPTSTKPNGLFTFSWCLADPTDGTCKASNLSYGQLSLTTDANGSTVVQLYDEWGGQWFQEACTQGLNCQDNLGNNIGAPVSIVDSINLTLSNHKLDSATGTSSQQQHTFSAIPAPGGFTLEVTNPTIYNLSFDTEHGLLRDPDEAPTDACYPLNDPDEYVHQYDLYNRANGNLKAVGGGIPVIVSSVTAGSTAAVNDRGWWDYWGLHIDGLASAGVAYEPKKITTGSTVTAQAASAVGISKGDVLNVNSAQGTLRTETSYEGIIPATDTNADDTTMYKWTPLNGQTFLYFDTTGGGANVRVRTAEAGYRFAGLGGGAQQAKDTDVTQHVDWCGQPIVNDYCFGAYSQAIGGWFNVSDVSALTYKAYVQTRVKPGTFGTDQYLKCYGSNCPRPMDGGILSTDGYGATDFASVNSDANMKYPFINPNGGTAQYYKFTIDDMTLKHCQLWDVPSSTCIGDLYPVICGTDEGVDECDLTDWSSSTHLYVDMVKHDVTVAFPNGWNQINAATRYIWTTSNNIYDDRLTWPSAAGNTISFNPPVNFAYDHTTANDRNGSSDYNGKKFGLEYAGNGNLWGIDWDQVDQTCTGNQCEYQPQISIEDGVVIDLGASEGGEHVILARRMDLRPTPLPDTSACTNKGLDVTTSTSAPPLPAIETIIDFAKADEPTGASLISTEVCVVDNVLTGATGCPTE